MADGVWDVIHSSDRHDWRTPTELFEALDEVFEFDLDAAAGWENALCKSWIDEKSDALSTNWRTWTEGVRAVWCNPPYGRDVGRWVDKAMEEARGGLTCVLLVMSCTETDWFRRGWESATSVIFLHRRVKFIAGNGKSAGSAPKGSVIFVFSPGGELPGGPSVTLWDWREELKRGWHM
jgi:phage N-6-adenine-methyltransferase